MDLSRLWTQFRRAYRKDNGERFFGDIAPLSAQTTSRLSYARLVLRVGPHSNVAPRDIIHTPEGRTFLVADRSDSDGSYLVARTFLLITMDRRLDWSRKTIVTDYVTGLPKGDFVEDLGTIWCVLERPSEINDDFHIPVDEYDLITNAALQVDDTVGDKFVTHVDTILGITVARVK